jgi:pseudaminic acid biosynthesis-associated methylase
MSAVFAGFMLQCRPRFGVPKFMSYSTEQEAFWAGVFGDAYSERNRGAQLLAAKTALFARILCRAHGVGSVVELGANIGLNLLALRTLLPAAKLKAVEINEAAFAQLLKIESIEAVRGSLFDYRSAEAADLAFTCGVLIHIAPDRLGDAYDVLFETSRRYVLICEYYNPTPVEVTYRGHAARLFKRDFAGEMLARFADLRLIDYGFAYHHDPMFPLDDFTWFLMEK